MRSAWVLGVLAMTLSLTACGGGLAGPVPAGRWQTQDTLGGFNLPAVDAQYAMGTTGTQNQTQVTGGDSAMFSQFGSTPGSGFGGFGSTGAPPGADPFGGLLGLNGYGSNPFGGAAAMGGFGGMAGLGMPMGGLFGI